MEIYSEHHDHYQYPIFLLKKFMITLWWDNAKLSGYDKVANITIFIDEEID
jgi:hypothetical protein